MLGLLPMEKIHQPKTTMDKISFLVEHVQNAHVPTTLVAFGAFGALVVLKYFKGLFRSGWIRGIPEVLIVVIVSTCACGQYLGSFVPWPLTGCFELQTSRRSFTGTKMVLTFSVLCLLTLDRPSLGFL